VSNSVIFKRYEEQKGYFTRLGNGDKIKLKKDNRYNKRAIKLSGEQFSLGKMMWKQSE
jgi:hypothetical protein